MPMINADDGCPIHVQVEGRDGAPVLMLSNSLGTNLNMWDDQAPEFSKHFRLVRYDRRGHGKSGVPKGPYSMERFGRDVIAVADALKIKKFNWCGLSMGGMVGQWLGANVPDRVEKLVLSNTNFHYADKAPWSDRIKFVQEKGLDALVDPNMERWFTKGLDITIAAEDAVFGEPELKFGAGIVVMILPWLVGPKRAKEIILTGADRIPAAEAERIGLINRVVPADELESAALALAHHIAVIDPHLVQQTKRAINQCLETMGLVEALNAALDIDLAIEGKGSDDKRKFMEIARRDGLRKAIAWRDARFGGNHNG